MFICSFLFFGEKKWRQGHLQANDLYKQFCFHLHLRPVGRADRHITRPPAVLKPTDGNSDIANRKRLSVDVGAG